MDLIKWNDTYSVQIKEIDDQHKKLIQMINDLHNAMSEGRGKLIVAQILDDLIDYTKTHFKTEEVMMEKCSYPSFRTHKEAHDILTQKVLDIQSRFQTGQVVVTIEVMNFLKDWLTQHILEMDKLYIPYLLK
jgi:hemerythrin